MIALLVALVVVVPVVCGGEAEEYERIYGSGYIKRSGFKECRNKNGEQLERCEEFQGLDDYLEEGVFHFKYRCCPQKDWSCNAKYVDQNEDCCPNSSTFCEDLVFDYCCDNQRQQCASRGLYDTCVPSEDCQDPEREMCGDFCCLKTEECYNNRCYPKYKCSGGICYGDDYKGTTEVPWARADSTCGDEPQDKCY